MSALTSTTLIGLPVDIQNLIVAALNAPSPLFHPKYHLVEEGFPIYGNLDEKHQEYYGNADDEAIAASCSLLKWSLTCRHYRTLLSPLVFQNLVLRTKPNSVAYCQALLKSDKWKLVKSLTVCGTYAVEERTLSNILSTLPPNLETLTLDFPTDWIVECEGRGDDDDYLSVLDTEESRDETVEFERTEDWRKMIFNVLDAIARNDISSKQDFQLRLFNLPPFPSSAHWTDKFHGFLNHVTDLVIALSHFDNGACWLMNTMEMPLHFASTWNTLFWNHLTNIKSLTINADYSWPFGLAPGRCHIPLALPEPDFRFQHLQSLNLKWWFIDSELISFINVHMPLVKDLTMTKYFADNKDSSSSEAEHTPTWSDFFNALRKHPNIQNVQFFPHLSGRRLLDPFDNHKDKLPTDLDDSYKTAFEEVQTLEASRLSMKETGTWTTLDDAHMKRVWPHTNLDEKYGDVFDAEEYNAQRFVEGSDHAAWLKLCAALEKRGGGCRVVDVGQGDKSD